MIMKEKRLSYIDIARAFAIIFIVLGHTIVHSQHLTAIYKLIYSFHIALFFILSGLTFKIKDNESFLSFFKRKFLRIMIPYFIWALVFLIPYMLFGNSIGSKLDITSSFNLKNMLFNILYGNGNMAALKQNTSLWFLPALFSMEIVYYFIIKFLKKHDSVKIVFLFLIVLIGFLSTTYFNNFIILPFGITTVLNIGVFFYIGYLLKEFNIIEKTTSSLKYIYILMLLIGVVCCFLNFQSVTCLEYEYGNFALALSSGICISLFVLFISKMINKNKMLEYLGKNTMGILIFHKIIILIFQSKLGLISHWLLSSNIFIELILSILIVIISIIISLLVTEIVRKIFPLSIGEAKNNVK